MALIRDSEPQRKKDLISVNLSSDAFDASLIRLHTSDKISSNQIGEAKRGSFSLAFRICCGDNRRVASAAALV